MKKFFFSLQFLLDYKKEKEERLKKELARMIGKEEEEKKILGKMEEKVAFYHRKLRKEKEEKILQMPLLLSCYSYLERLMEDIEKKREEIKRLAQEKEKLKRKILQASRERKLLEKVREKRWAEFVQLKEKTEQQLIDESATVRFHQRTKS